MENLIEIIRCRLGRSWAALGAAKTRHISDGFGASLGAEVFKLFKVCCLVDGYKAAKTWETHISEYFCEKKLQKTLGKPLGPILRQLSSGLKRKKHLFGTCFRRILAILGRLKRPWEATKAPKKPLEGILG